MPAVPEPASPDAGTRGILDALPEPSLVLQDDGLVLFINGAASARLGALPGRKLAELVPPAEQAATRAYLVRCSGLRGALPGSLVLRCTDGKTARFRCHGGLAAPARDGRAAQLLLRLLAVEDERFSALARDVRRLNAEIRARRKAQAVLEEALRDREVMLRELHHRVKNSIQMLTGMVAGAEREAGPPEARRVLREVAGRLGAVAAVHQMLYRAGSIERLDGSRFAAELGAAILRSYAAEQRLCAVGTPGAMIPNDAAAPLALILNELLVNAVKHGAPEGEIRVALSYVDPAFELTVDDDGPGFDPGLPTRRASGLGLVRGLARQLGGSFAVGRGARGGARCTLRFEAATGMAP